MQTNPQPQPQPAPDHARHSGSFVVDLTGDIEATIAGDATFSQLPSLPGAPPAFGLALGPLSTQGAVFFSNTNGDRPGLGNHPVSSRGNGSDVIRAVVVLGPVERPFGELPVQAGTLTIVSSTDSRIVGTFTLDASGRWRGGEELRLSLSGSFSARAVGLRAPEPIMSDRKPRCVVCSVVSSAARILIERLGLPRRQAAEARDLYSRPMPATAARFPSTRQERKSNARSRPAIEPDRSAA